MAINKHNLPMHGLRKAAGDTRNSLPARNCYMQISYDRDDGAILSDFHCSLGGNSWTQYHDASIITACTTSKPMTMQQIADAIADAIAEQDFCAN